jgi:catechol 2,3-dioxygenase-like lactoylglutathione lyase family enzyme
VGSTLVAVAFDSPDPSKMAGFWAELLGREVVESVDRGVLLPGEGGQVGLRFSPVQPAGPNLLHLHLTSTDAAQQAQTVARALQLGARHLDVGQRPEEGHVVLADPEGHAFCVIEPGNPFLAGCGFLGEVACDGTRTVGLFWGETLRWPLVWDQDQETAVQPPDGGTKVAWSGSPPPPRRARARQRFELATPAGDLPREVARLTLLGATHLATREDGCLTLADPDGAEFDLLPE